ncbi:peptidoglycan DD-metalloendopeptidase family protein [Sphingoaurantiacus capsulatus]|uniref:Peptidoglycan DD-metalloendopeptidase family protein n=1 Tax=Sphingoaurantiacus capsulatus TaxID=1771310 RepID=A0ABV7XBA5_9SPHN
MIQQVDSLIQRYFPEHQIYLRSGGSVRLIKIGTRVQLMAAGTTALVALWMGTATVSMVSGADQDDIIAAKQAELRQLEAQVAYMKADVSNLKGDVLASAQRIEQRQAFLANLLSGKADLNALAAMLPKAGTAVAAHGDAKHASLLAPFAKLEREQLAFVDQATAAAEARYKDTQALIRRLGLEPGRFVGQSSVAMGGPLEPADGEPKFQELFLSWKKVERLEASLGALPSVQPVKRASYTSSYGVRYDPFSGRAAMHAGVDLAGAHGEPILATADGVVHTAGWGGAYGKMVQIGHGKGLATRYGHMSRLTVRAGERVKKGDIIGRMGSTGRSTGTHLHYEVRVDGRAVNPMPFLRASNTVLAIQNRVDGVGQGGPEIPAAD